jgi:hypothetical protein
MSADGGAGIARGGGGGGRIAVVVAVDASGFDLTALHAYGGAETTSEPGAPGTIYHAAPGATPQLIVDSGPVPGGPGSTSFGSATTGTPFGTGLDIIVRDATVRLVDPLEAATLTIAGAGLVRARDAVTVTTLTLADQAILRPTDSSPTYASALDLVADAIVVAPGAAIDVSGAGYRGEDQANSSAPFGDGNVLLPSATAAGGSHAGLGGGTGPAPVYGDPLAPTSLGTGGATTEGDNSLRGGNGGGRMRVQATSLQLDGALLADGQDGWDVDGLATGFGGGAGGSIYLIVGTLMGAGPITASGGDGGLGGGGGGGYIAYQVTDATGYGGAMTALGGGGGGPAGGVGSVQALP